MVGIQRQLIVDLAAWRKGPDRKPLLIRGARQVGKTWAVQEWCRQESLELLTINFEEKPQLARLFERDLDIDRIVDDIAMTLSRSLRSPNAVLFLDEIQVAPKAITALRYFYERRPELVVIAAGSLIEFVLEEHGVPVGRVQSKFVYPLSFIEFLGAIGRHGLADALSAFRLEELRPFSPVVHEEFLSSLRLYYQIGGMPKAVSAYLSEKDMRAVANEHATLIRGYMDDFRKYAKKVDWALLETIFLKMSAIAGGPQVKFSAIESQAKSTQVRRALLALEQALIIHKIRPTHAPRLPLVAHAVDKGFKLAFLDIGLLHHLLGFDWTRIAPDADLTDIADGRFAEQFVAQEIITTRSGLTHYPLHYWNRAQAGSEAEVDFVIEWRNAPAPVEVKSGTKGRLRSLQLYINELNPPAAFVLSQRNVEKWDRITSLPLYLASRLHDSPAN